MSTRGRAAMASTFLGGFRMVETHIVNTVHIPPASHHFLPFWLVFPLPFHFNRVKEGLSRKDPEEKREEISLQQLGASPLKETI